MKKKLTMKTRIRALTSALSMALIALPIDSHATNVESVLNKAASFLTGPLAKSAGVVVLIGAGWLCLVQQKFPKEQLAMVLVGLGIIFGASSLYSFLI